MENNNFKINCDIHKVNEDEHLVFAWASVNSVNGELVTDSQGDVIPDEELEKAAYDYVLNSRRAGEMHVRKRDIGEIVESIVFSKTKQDLLGIDLGKTGWFIGFKIYDEEVWDMIKKGDYPMLSIGGRGVREKIDDPE